MRLNWERWFYDLADRCMRHVGTAILTWGGLSVRHRAEISGTWFMDLITSIACGAIIPTVAAYMANKGLPKDEDEKEPVDNDSDRPTP